MQQITKTVEQFLSFIVAVGLICFTSFVFLLASAQLNDSRLGELLAELAGETAYTARTESFSYWGRVGNEVAGGLGYGDVFPGGAGGGSGIPAATTVPNPNATAITIRPTPIPQATLPNPTQIAVNAEHVLLSWRGVNAGGILLPKGVDLSKVSQEAQAVLAVDRTNPLATWVQKHVEACQPNYAILATSNYQDANQSQTIIAAADGLINSCNPRIYQAYALRRWAQLAAWRGAPEEVPSLLAGLNIVIYSKEGPARLKRPEDLVSVEVQRNADFNLEYLTMGVPVSVLNQIFGEGNWDVNQTKVVSVPGSLYPVNPPEPVLPTQEELNVPTPTPQPTSAGTVGISSAGGTYIVQAGDTANSIAKKFNVTLDALIAANPSTLGYNAHYIVVGQELIIPASTP